MSIKKLLKWAGKRAKEPSTYAGLAIIAGAVGGPAAGVAVGKVGQVVGLIFGTGLVAATTSAHPEARDSA